MRMASYSKSAEKINRTLMFIKQFVAQNNYAPSVREICDGVGFKSTASAQYYLEKLDEQGYIRKANGGKNRAIELLSTVKQDESLPVHATRVPLLGNVAAGLPLDADVAVDENFVIPTDFFSCTDKMFLLRVRGDSMIDIGIFDGDMVLIEQSETARNGEIVVAQLDSNEVTLKRFYKENDFIVLHPENSRMRDIIVNPDQQIRILGIARGLMRNRIY